MRRRCDHAQRMFPPSHTRAGRGLARRSQRRVLGRAKGWAIATRLGVTDARGHALEESRRDLGRAIALAAGAADEACSQFILPLPPGTVVTGTVFKQPGQCPPPSVPSIATGTDANAYICSTPPTLSFEPSAPAAMVVTSVPTQYVRVYCPECSPPSFPNRSIMADPALSAA